ncbi:hypothetical protein MsAg5_16430 [Methanosarcinaceae archaeon Ag5]|uniref:Uncharacterized protein n=1 Tax=Methanolapillus africanus TaxID=3028297 RepID=A0AAE4SDM5_9EURY|nr:hypothetical protein [Methanosarcinaceae archaeon Ag5]
MTKPAEETDFDVEAEFDSESELEYDLKSNSESGLGSDSEIRTGTNISIPVPSGITVSPLIGHNYLKPAQDEKVFIQVLDFKKMYACWLPGLRYTLYFDEEPKTEELKRIRQIVLLEVYDGNGKRLIELNDEEFEQFEMVYDMFSTYGGEIWFYRQKTGRRLRKNFWLKQKNAKPGDPIRKYNLSDMV